MDAILQTGDELYRKIPHKHKYVDYTELPKDIQVDTFNSVFHCEPGVILCGYLMSRDSSGELYSLEDASVLACQSGNGLLLTSCGYTVSVMSVSNTFLLHDSHSRDQGGLSHPDGTAVLMKFDNVSDLTKHVQRLYRGSLHAQFDVVSFNIRLVGSMSRTVADNPSSSDSVVQTRTVPAIGTKTLNVKLKDGRSFTISGLPRTAQICDQTKVTQEPDKVKDYALLAMEFGLLFQNFLGSIKTPNRNRMMRTLKLMMVLLKADSNMCRYADEILRFLVHQTCILSEREAHQMFYGMFVNTKGKLDSFIPCDLMMEFVVRATKKHIKHMHSNKTERNVE